MKTIDLLEYYEGIVKMFDKLESSEIRKYIAWLNDDKFSLDEKRKIKTVVFYAGLYKVIELLKEKKKTIGRNIDFNDVVDIAVSNYTEMLSRCINDEVSFEDFYHFMSIYLFKSIHESYEEYKNRTINK